jgi:hypothetical protein
MTNKMKNTYQLKIKRISYDYYGKFDSEKQALEWAVSAKGKKTIGGQTLLKNVEVIR